MLVKSQEGRNMVKNNLPNRDLVMGGKYKDAPTAHYPNWVFNCPDCGYYELPQGLPDIQEAYEHKTLFYSRSCGCRDGTVKPSTLRMEDIF